MSDTIIKLVLLQAKFRATKADENEIKTLVPCYLTLFFYVYFADLWLAKAVFSN